MWPKTEGAWPPEKPRSLSQGTKTRWRTARHKVGWIPIEASSGIWGSVLTLLPYLVASFSDRSLTGFVDMVLSCFLKVPQSPKFCQPSPRNKRCLRVFFVHWANSRLKKHGTGWWVLLDSVSPTSISQFANVCMSVRQPPWSGLEVSSPIIKRLTLSLFRVISFKFPLQLHQKYYITQYVELGVSHLTQIERRFYQFSLPLFELTVRVKGLKRHDLSKGI